ncbi:N-acetyltransferase [Nitratireductor aquimarinus]|uniref:N-acetyltransferase n=1 Tax=Alphaproteobacteria TaxID=28211 RepID=UPI0019D38C2F|nr:MULTISPECIES: N-acetyltransferase [Alphaproteobacteria]MBN7755490.1 N-acetyltransferase [Nitratireductor aquimarinus]MBY5998245.1 N-acetyltransferase [Tritonibacter mobilis]MBY6020273.1 N-acetyltransferase [Nitratireductor sp. DP7N14-4]
MTNIVWGSSREPELNEALGSWCAAHIEGVSRLNPPFTTMGVIQDDQIVAVMLYHNWDPDAGVIEISGSAITPKWLTRPVLWSMFDYPFNGMGNQLVAMRVSERNVMWNGRGLPRLLKSYGFKSHFIPRLRGRDEGEILYTLTDDDWRANRFHKENR